jgi:hypothetical protein
LNLRVLAAKRRPHVAAGVSPQKAKQKKLRAAKRRQQLVARNALPPLRGSKAFFAFPPWAYAHGYVRPSLRDSGNAQLQKA